MLSLFLLGFTMASLAYSEEAQESKPDTLLVLKNGAEVRGVFIELKEGMYSLRLADGRVMSYAATEVERMQRLSAAEPAAAMPSVTQTAPFVCRTFITEKDLDKTLYVFVKFIKVKKGGYGSATVVYGKMAEAARGIGADAVISIHTWQSSHRYCPETSQPCPSPAALQIQGRMSSFRKGIRPARIGGPLQAVPFQSQALEGKDALTTAGETPTLPNLRYNPRR